MSMSMSMFETYLPDEIILKICRYLSWFDVFIAFYNLNTRLNQTISGFVKYVSIGDDCSLKQFQYGCFFLLYHQSSLFCFIRTLTISNRGSPLAAKYFLSHIPIQNMIYLEKLTLIEVTGEEIISFLDLIERAGENMFQHLIKFEIYDPEYITNTNHNNLEEQKQYESNIINRILTGNNYRLKSIMINGDDMFMQTNIKKILNPCFNLYTLSIMMLDDDDLISLFTIIPNIHCLYLSLRHIRTIAESSLWSSTVLLNLIEFYFWAESAHDLSMDDLITLLCIMPALQRVSLNFITRDVRLLNGEQVQSIFSAANILSLEEFNYAVEYFGDSLEHDLIWNIPQTWLQRPIALTFDVEYRNVCLHTIPFKFHKFWPRISSREVKKLIAEKNLTTYYGDDAYIDHCSTDTTESLSALYTVMQKCYHVEKVTLSLPRETEKHIFEPTKELVTSMSIQQQRFNLTSLHLFGRYCDSMQLIHLLFTFGSHLRKLHVDFDCLLNLIRDVNDTTQLKSVMLHKYLVYLELDGIFDSHIDSEDFPRVMNFLFDNKNGFRHVTILTMWYLQIFKSDDDMRLLLKILSSFKHYTKLMSIIICHCVFSNQFCNDKEIKSTENDMRKWLNDNTHLTFEQNIDLQCDSSNKILKLWFD